MYYTFRKLLFFQPSDWVGVGPVGVDPVGPVDVDPVGVVVVVVVSPPSKIYKGAVAKQKD